MNVKLAAIATNAAADLQSFVKEAETDILDAWAAAEAEAADNETKPKLRLGFTVTLDLDADSMETKLSFGVRHVLSRDQAIPDPAQTKLDLDDKPQVRAAKLN